MRSRAIFTPAVALLFLLACSESTSADGHGASADEKKPDVYNVEHVKVGTGKSPGPTSRVTVHYHGTFADGRVFDSSKQRGQPATFPLNRVIKCWTDGLQTMKEGGVAKLTCPGDVAYGPRGRPPKIPPNATLYFDVELIQVE